MSRTADAVVIGAGPNGLVAANRLADAGWDVVVVEGAARAGGAVASGEVTAPGFTNDLYSAFYPLSAAGPAPIARLGLEHHGLRWAHAPDVVAHPLLDRPGPVLSRDRARMMASLGGSGSADAAGWERLLDRWAGLRPVLLPGLLAPRPPVAAAARWVRRRGTIGVADDVRFLLLSARRMAEEAGCGEAGTLLLGGNALHGDVLLEAPGSGVLGILLCGLGHEVGFPVPVGGAGRLVDALLQRLGPRGGEVRVGTPVSRVVVRDGRARGVILADGTTVHARRAVLAAVTAPALDPLVAEPWRTGEDERRFEPSLGTVKVDWALRSPVPWTDEGARRAGTVHVAPSVDELSVQAHQLARGVVPDRPFVIVGQMTTADPSRSPAGTESAWAYTHVPATFRADAAGVVRGDYGADDTARLAERIEAQIERLAPGFGGTIIARHVTGPRELERANPSLFGGDIAGGTVQLYQQGPFRPAGRLGSPTTRIDALFLASSSIHPGGGVHGGPGDRAARAALRRARVDRVRSAVRRG